MLPFRSGMHVAGDDFCGRKKELKILTDYILSGMRVYLVGERRVGKSSLILEAVRQQRGYRPLYIDLLAIKTTDDLCKRMIKALITMERSESWLIKMLKEFSVLRPNITVDPLTSLPSVGLSPSVKLQPESIESILDIIGSLKQTVVIFDEFQDLLNLKEANTALALLRSKIQRQTDTCYCFAGSVRSQMDELFTDRNSPFFKSAFALHVGPLEQNEFGSFLLKKFKTGQRTVAAAALETVMEIGCNNPGDIQRLCVALWQVSSAGDTITKEHLPGALEFIFTVENRSYEDIVEQVSAQQMDCLRALSIKGGSSNLSSDFLLETGIGLVTSVRKAMNRLVERRILFRHEKIYRFCDPFFRAWILHNNL